MDVAEVTQPLAICDGSESIRFGYDSDGGRITDHSGLFYTHYGSFLYVHGDCSYVAGTGSNRSFRAGVLSAALAEQLSAEVDYRTLDSRARKPEHQTCLDAPVEHYHGPNATLRSQCSSQTRLRTIHALADVGPMVEAAVTVAVLAGTGTGGAPPPSAPAWPIATSILTFFTSLGATPGVDDGVRVDDLDDAAALRELRDTTAPVSDAPAFVVQEGGLAYRVYVRDELPEDMEAAVQALLAEREPRE